MIYDVLEAAQQYYAIHSRLRAGFEFLRSVDLGSLPVGRHEIDGDRLFVNINAEIGRTRAGARLESHRVYADIQVAIAGEDLIGWLPLDDCQSVAEAYDRDRDIAFFADTPKIWLPLPPGRFAVFYPRDAHAPLGGEGPVMKAVVKVAL
jgi:YhcH/YjgK/YiaL family protein